MIQYRLFLLVLVLFGFFTLSCKDKAHHNSLVFFRIDNRATVSENEYKYFGGVLIDKQTNSVLCVKIIVYPSTEEVRGTVSFTSLSSQFRDIDNHEAMAATMKITVNDKELLIKSNTLQLYFKENIISELSIDISKVTTSNLDYSINQVVKDFIYNLETVQE